MRSRSRTRPSAFAGAIALGVLATALLAPAARAADGEGGDGGEATDPPAPAEQPGEVVAAADPVEGQYIVVLDGVGAANVEDTAAELAAEVDGEVFATYETALQGFAVRTTPKQAEAIAADPRVDHVEEDGVVEAIGTDAAVVQPNATWGLDRIDQRDLPLDGSYEYEADGTGVTAYIIDTGIRITHQDFGGRASHGADLIGDGQNGNDCHGHGTHVAGTVGGSEWGVAKGVDLVAVRVLNCQGSGSNAGVIGGIDWVTANAPDDAVANMSLGGGASTAVDTAVQNSIAAGVSYALAAGNESTNACNGSPARTPEAITVGATDSTDTRASFSNFGTCLDLFAPGVNITSAWNGSDTDTNTISGTSMASPHTAGMLAVLTEENPGATPAQLGQILVDEATPGKVNNPGSGSVNKLLFHEAVDPTTGRFTISLDGIPGLPTDFGFTGCGSLGCGSFSLDDDDDPTLPSQVVFADLTPDTYTVTQDGLPAGWNFDDLTCNQGTVDVPAREVVVDVAAGDRVACTFANSTTAVTVVVDDADDTGQDFSFEGCGSLGCGSFDLDDDADPTLSDTKSFAVAPDTYTIRPTAPREGWTLVSVECPGETTDPVTGLATIDLAADEHVTCTWVGEQIDNDDFVNADLLSGASGSVQDTNVEATKQPGEPNHAGDPGGASIWFDWTAPANGTATFATHGSDFFFDTLLAVYTGDSVGALTEVASNNDAGFWIHSEVSFPVTAGTTYRVAVDGAAGLFPVGTVNLAWSTS